MKERKITQTKDFMRLFLTTDAFDDWFLTEAQIVCANTWSVDGRRNRAYYTENGARADEVSGEEFSLWADVRPVAFSLIRGKRTPLSFRFILQPPGDGAAGADIPGADRVCRIRFAEGHVHIASAVSMKIFSLEKEGERLWDEACSRFLDEKGIAFEEL